jgi:V8-like Glu-specific endopeptidase
MTMLRRLARRLAPLVAVLLPACVDDPTLGTEGAHVIGGSATIEGEFPGVGGLMYDFGNGPMLGCTGTLIAPDAVLTAAHCVDPDLVGPAVPGFTLALDATGATGVPPFVAGRAAFAHEQFDINAPITDGLAQFFDVGVVLLAEPITTVAPVRMPRPDQAAAIIANLDLEIVGYGRIDPNTDQYGIMFDAQTKLVSLNATELQVGSGAPEPQNCNGDSGGPGLANLGDGRRVVGVVSRSFSGAECVNGGVDTRVDAYLTWIHGKVTSGIPCGSGLAEPCPVEPEEEEEEGGCCAAGGGGGPGTALLALLVGLAVFVRPRRAGRR